MKVAVVLLATIAFAFAEPPVPSSQYLPSNQYIPPSNQYGAPRPFSPPSTSYGAPVQTEAVIRPNNAYGPPKPQYGPPGDAYLPPNGGYGSGKGGYDDQGEPANYEFAYHVEDPPSGNDFGHEEARQGDVAKGKYFVLLPDGRLQTVEYTADTDGYKPKISYQQVGGGYASGGPGGAGGYQY